MVTFNLLNYTHHMTCSIVNNVYFQLADKLSDQFKVRFEAVANIKEAVEDNYGHFPELSNYDDKYTECCNVDPKSLEYEPMLAQLVSLKSTAD